MREGKENFNDAVQENEIISSPGDDAAFEHQAAEYRFPETFLINGNEVSVASLRKLEVPGLVADHEISDLSAAERGELGEMLADVAEVADVAQTLEAPIEAKTAALATAFFSASPEEEQQMAEAQEIVSADDDAGSRMFRWMNTKGKKLLAAVTIAIGASAMPQAANAGRFFHQGGRPVMERVIGGVERGVDAKRQIEDIALRQQQLRIEIDHIEREKAIIMQRSGGDTHVGGMAIRAESNARAIQLESRYEAEKAKIEGKKAALQAKFAAKANPTAVDIAKHQEQLAKLDAREIRAEGNYQSRMAREEGRSIVRGGQIRNAALDAGSDIHRLESEQQRKFAEIQRLEQEKTNIMIRGGADIFRR